MTIDASVITPSFRRPRQSREAPESVRRQRGVERDIVVIDESPKGSERKTIDEIQDPRISCIVNPAATGGVPSAVRNIGLPLGKGALIHFLDDDIVCENHYPSAKDVFDNHPEVSVVFGRIEPFGEAPADQIEDERRFFSAAARRAASCNKLGAHDPDRVSPGYRVGALSPMYAPVLTDADIRHHENGRRRTQAKFRCEHGSLEYFAMKVFTRTVLRLP
jgi:hypothetical protein